MAVRQKAFDSIREGRGGGASAFDLAMSLEAPAPASKSPNAQNLPAPHSKSRDSIARSVAVDHDALLHNLATS